MSHSTRRKANTSGATLNNPPTILAKASTDGNGTNDPANLSRDELIIEVFSLRSENNALVEVKKYMEETNERLIKLEREQNLSFQYLRRDSVVISGIPNNIKQDALEDEVVRIFDMAKVVVNNSKLDKSQIQGCHRIGKKGNVIVKTVNRKYAMESLYCGKNLKGKSPYETPVYINNSFCKEYQFLNFLVRRAKREGHVYGFKVKRGITRAQMHVNSELVDITHKKIDLVNLGISVTAD